MSKWNLSSLYSTRDDWEKDLQTLLSIAENQWVEIKQFEGTLASDSSTLKKFLTVYLRYRQKVDKIVVYAHLHYDQDMTNMDSKKGYELSVNLMQSFRLYTAWIDSEILNIELDVINQYIEKLPEFAFLLKKILHSKPYCLDKTQEELVAKFAKAKMTPYSAFSAMNNLDLDFGYVEDSKGKKHLLNNASYHSLLRSFDGTLRKNCFVSLHSTFGKFENTLFECLKGQVEFSLCNAKIRGYNSCLEAAIHKDNINVSVYTSLIEEVKSNVLPMHNYVNLRKSVMGEISLCDMYVPLVKNCDVKIEFPEAVDIVTEAVKPLGNDYCNLLRKGLTEDGWVDVYHRKGKRFGAYSSGCYGSNPYILMNYQNNISDVLTLAHEVGHSMHSLLSNKRQPYQYSKYSIFIAEMASTLNEYLVYEYLLKNAKSGLERAFVLNQQIDSVRATFFRQTMFADFELKMSHLAEKGMPLTVDCLKREYMDLNKVYFGDNINIEKEVCYEFLRIPHFYYNFYVYQYATGIAAAFAFLKLVKKKGPNEYLECLSSGGMDYPLNLLKKYGVNLSNRNCIRQFTTFFKSLVDRLKDELTEAGQIS